MKRYAIVRVDNCPSKFEKGFNDYFVCDGRGKDTRLGADKINCEKCNYGDTKEQFVNKIVTAMDRIYVEQYKNSEAYSYKKIARKIVEFLGVK